MHIEETKNQTKNNKSLFIIFMNICKTHFMPVQMHVRRE
jgi:hypothetical protein